MTAYVYRLYDANDSLLYVGFTNHGMQRMGQHLSSKAWWPEVLTTRWEHFDTAPEALEAEASAIHNEGPRYNFSPRGRGRPPIGPATTIRLPDDLRQELDAIAERDGMTLAALLREVLENYCREDGR